MAIYDTFANNHPVIQIHNALTVNSGCRGFAVLADEVADGRCKGHSQSRCGVDNPQQGGCFLDELQQQIRENQGLPQGSGEPGQYFQAGGLPKAVWLHL